jgi:hypothetical protein
MQVGCLTPHILHIAPSASLCEPCCLEMTFVTQCETSYGLNASHMYFSIAVPRGLDLATKSIVSPINC